MHWQREPENLTRMEMMNDDEVLDRELQERNHLGDLDVDGRMILNLILDK
jgi:hypothetical protein